MGKEVLPSFINETRGVRAELGLALKGVREELDEHLETINQATEEVQSNYEYLYKLDDKVDRLSERIEQLALLLKNSGMDVSESIQEKVELTDQEKEVFLVLYTAGDGLLSYKEIAEGVRESEFLVRGYITNMIHKGIPIKKKFVNSDARVQLDKRFKEHQAKTNFLKISQKTVKEFC